MVKAHNILLGITFMSLIILGLGNFYILGTETYGASDIDEDQINVFTDQLEEMKTITDDTRDSIDNIVNPDNPFDVLGGIFMLGWNAFRNIGQSFDSLFTITTSGTESIPFISENFSNALITTLITAIGILIFIAILLHGIIKSDRT